MKHQLFARLRTDEAKWLKSGRMAQSYVGGNKLNCGTSEEKAAIVKCDHNNHNSGIKSMMYDSGIKKEKNESSCSNTDKESCT